MADDESGRRRARGELESEVMAALWSAGAPLTPAGVQAALGDGLAYNTVQTARSARRAGDMTLAVYVAVLRAWLIG
jgi:hypothetical protein